MKYFKIMNTKKTIFALLTVTALTVARIDAATFVADSPFDAGDMNPGDGVCASALSGNPCTLRAAVQEANALPERDRIELLGIVYTLNISGVDDTAAAGDLDILDDVDFIGSPFTALDVTHGDLATFSIFAPANVRFDSVPLQRSAGSPNSLDSLFVHSDASISFANASLDSIRNEGNAYLENVSFVDTGRFIAIDNNGFLSGDRVRIENASGTRPVVNSLAMLLTRSVISENGEGVWSIGSDARISIANSVLYLNPGAQLESTNYGLISYTSLVSGAGIAWTGNSLLTRASLFDDSCHFADLAQSLDYNLFEDPNCVVSLLTNDAIGIVDVLAPFNSFRPTGYLNVSRDFCSPFDWQGHSRYAENFCTNGAYQFGSPALPACSNGVDDDRDGLIDLLDPGCRNGDDPLEVHMGPGDFLISNFVHGSPSLFDPVSTLLTPILPYSGGGQGEDVVVDGNGSINMTDYGVGTANEYDIDDGVIRIVTGDVGQARGLTFANGKLLMGDAADDAIYEVDENSGAKTLVFSNPAIDRVSDLQLDPSDGSILLTDTMSGLFRLTDPFGSPSLQQIFGSGFIISPRQITFAPDGDIVLAENVTGTPVRYDVQTGTDAPMVSTDPFDRLYGAAAEQSGYYLFTDNQGQVWRLSEANDTVTPLNFGRAEVGLKNIDDVPQTAQLSLSLSDTLLVDNGSSGIVDIGDVIQLTATITNAGSGTADELSFESGLDPNSSLSASSLTTSQGTIEQGSLATDERVQIALGSLAPGATATVTWDLVISDPAPRREITANAWVRRNNIILAESNDPTTGPANDPNIIGIGNYGVISQVVSKISDTQGALSGAGNPGATLPDSCQFGFGSTELGDIDNDGVPDHATTSVNYPDTGGTTGAIHFVTMNTDGSVKAESRITPTSPGLLVALTAAGLPLIGDDELGTSITNLGDLDGAGPADYALAVGASVDDGNGQDRGAVYILFMQNNPTDILSIAKIGDGIGGFPTGLLSNFDEFGRSVANVGDINGDGVTDLAVGAWNDNLGAPGNGAVYTLFLNTTGQVIATPVKIQPPVAGPNRFGTSVAPLGLFDGDSVPDMVVGGFAADGIGALWIVTLNLGGTPKAFTKIADGLAGLPASTLDSGDWFGWSVGLLDDLDGNGTPEIGVGAPFGDDDDPSLGALYALFLDKDTPVTPVIDVVKWTGGNGLPAGQIDTNDELGTSVATLGDIDGDGINEIGVGARYDDDGGSGRGALYVIFPDAYSVIDTDGDGVTDNVDNCTDITNASQLDTNGDGYGNACDPDLDNNGVVNFLDASIFGGLFGPGTGDGDFNGDGNTNFLDYAIFPAYFGGPPGPSGIAP